MKTSYHIFCFAPPFSAEEHFLLSTILFLRWDPKELEFHLLHCVCVCVCVCVCLSVCLLCLEGHLHQHSSNTAVSGGGPWKSCEHGS